MAEIKPKLSVDVNHNPTKKGIKVQFVLPQTLQGDAKAQATQKLQAKLNQGLSQYNLTVSQDTDVPYANVIGFLIPIADVKLLIKNAIGAGNAPEESTPATAAPAPEAPVNEIERMQELAGIKENMDVIKTLADNYVNLKKAIANPNYPSTAHTNAALYKIEDKIKQMSQKEEYKQEFMKLIPKNLEKILSK
jgi:hypothetical protein